VVFDHVGIAVSDLAASERLARVMGTSVAMIERHYGALLDGAHAGIAGRLDAFVAELERACEVATREN
jgi:hypothetical protein